MSKLTFEDGYNQALKDYESNKNLEDLYMTHALGQKGFWWHNPKLPDNFMGNSGKHNDYKFITTKYDKGYFKALDELYDVAGNIKNLNTEYNTIKNYILELEKVLEIINEKGLPLGEIKMIKQSENYEKYVIDFSWANFKNISIQKTQEEFDLIKENL